MYPPIPRVDIWKKKSAKELSNDAYAMFILFFLFFVFHFFFI